MNFELLTEAAAISHEELAKITGNEHYPSSRRIRTLKAALAQAGAHPRAFAAAGPEADYSRIDRRNTPSVVINQAGPASRSEAVPRKMFDRTEGGNFTRFAEHLVDFACVKLLGIDHLSGVLLDND
jgi:hypothetical protein